MPTGEIERITVHAMRLIQLNSSALLPKCRCLNMMGVAYLLQLHRSTQQVHKNARTAYQYDAREIRYRFRSVRQLRSMRASFKRC